MHVDLDGFVDGHHAVKELGNFRRSRDKSLVVCARGLDVSHAQHFFGVEKVTHGADAAKHGAVAHSDQNLGPLAHQFGVLHLVVIAQSASKDSYRHALFGRVLEVCDRAGRDLDVIEQLDDTLVDVQECHMAP